VPDAPSPASPHLAPGTTSLWRLSDLALGAGLATLGFLVLLGSLVAAAVLLDGGPSDDSVPRALLAAVVTLLFEAWLGAVVWYLARRRRLTGEDLGLSQPGRLRWAIYAVAGAYGSLIVYGIFVALMERLTQADLEILRQGNRIPDSAGNNPLVWGVLGVSVVVVAPLAEELFFRAFLFRAVEARLGLAAGVLLSALTFSVFHMNIGVVVPFFAIGVILVWVYHATGSLWTPIAAHATINGISFIATLAGVGS
jgi:membrane protease YdiL (CAAX protease family)